MEKSDLLSMSDEDFLKLDSAPQVLSAEEQAAAAEAAAANPSTEQQPENQEQTQQDPETTTTTSTEEPETPEEPETTPAENQPSADVRNPLDGKQPAATAPVIPKEGEQPAAQEEQPLDYKALYENLMKPLRANGKDIQLKTPEELIQLAQMGANYTRKMQEIAPHRKTLLMLEKNGLLDESKLSFLIDLTNKNPDAIQKFLKESGVNPLDIDTEAESQYRPGNHQVSDEEATFRSVLDDVNSTEIGRQTLQHINNTWDQASKELLYTQPGIMEVMAQQKEAGFYDRISSEMDRRRMLGQVPAGQTWLQTYKEVGQQMANVGAFNDLVAKEQQQPQNPAPATPAPVATRTLQPKPQVVPNDKAKAAAPTRTAPAPAKTLVNPLAMSDDEFLKKFENRL